MGKYILLTGLLYIGLAKQNLLGQQASNRDAGSQIEGIYKVRQMTIFTLGKVLQSVDMTKPGNTLTATITAKRKSERYISLILNQFQNSTQMLSFRYGDAYLKNTAKGYDLAIDGNKVGVTNGSTLTIDISSTDKKTGVVSRSLIVCKKG